LVSSAGEIVDEWASRVLATLSARDLVPEIWLPDPAIRRERELARFDLVHARLVLLHCPSGAGR
jgi:hypothetical protein